MNIDIRWTKVRGALGRYEGGYVLFVNDKPVFPVGNILPYGMLLFLGIKLIQTLIELWVTKY